jgi:1,6-anhydro-N-acetylmuramate kinase
MRVLGMISGTSHDGMDVATLIVESGEGMTAAPKKTR